VSAQQAAVGLSLLRVIGGAASRRRRCCTPAGCGWGAAVARSLPSRLCATRESQAGALSAAGSRAGLLLAPALAPSRFYFRSAATVAASAAMSRLRSLVKGRGRDCRQRRQGRDAAAGVSERPQLVSSLTKASRHCRDHALPAPQKQRSAARIGTAFRRCSSQNCTRKRSSQGGAGPTSTHKHPQPTQTPQHPPARTHRPSHHAAPQSSHAVAAGDASGAGMLSRRLCGEQGCRVAQKTNNKGSRSAEAERNARAAYLLRVDDKLGARRLLFHQFLQFSGPARGGDTVLYGVGRGEGAVYQRQQCRGCSWVAGAAKAGMQ
jgi:hypothetical protein